MSRHSIESLIDITREPNWRKVNDFVIACGNAHDPKSFVAAFLNGAAEICRFDRAIVFFFDGNGKIVHQHLNNFSSETSEYYLSSFANNPETGTKEYSTSRDYREKPDVVDLSIIDWTDEPVTAFIREYIRPQNLMYTMSIVLYDLYGKPRTVLALDKLEKIPWTGSELTDMYFAMPHLSNLHKNFFYSEEGGTPQVRIFTPETSNLTRREAEIANLLCQGVSPANVSSTLYISIATTYKHISNIYEKLGISSQRELLALMLSR